MKINSLEVKSIFKCFPGVKALDNVSLEIEKGEVHALCGENGAGKSTLMNILSGNLTPDKGEIYVNGKKIKIHHQLEAQALSISIVYQDRSLIETLSVAENIFTTNKPHNRWGWIDYPLLYRNTQALLDRLHIRDIHPKSQLKHLSSAQQQMVEIAKALSQNPQLLILDEPTASITETETRILFNIIRDLKKNDVSIIYISHRMAEIFEIADRVSVLKDGKYQGTRIVSKTTVDEIIRMMVGRQLINQNFQCDTLENVLLDVRNLCGLRFRNISFKLRKGEILALAGLVGAGRTEVARTIMGIDQKRGGEICLEGKHIEFNHPQTASKHGLGYLPEERKTNGLFLDMSVEDNIVATHLSSTSKNGFIQQYRVKRTAEQYIKMLRINTPSSKQKVINLSGGNQQKIVLAKCLLRQPKVFIIDEPTHGVDVGAKAEIYNILKELTKQGVAILLISSELPEVLAISDRILVMWNGQITAELSQEEATEEEIMHFASGTKMMFA